MKGPGHLRLVSPPAPTGMPVEVELFAFLRVGNDIFVCHQGEWDLALNHAAARDALLKWTAAIADQIPAEAPDLRWPVRPA